MNLHLRASRRADKHAAAHGAAHARRAAAEDLVSSAGVAYAASTLAWVGRQIELAEQDAADYAAQAGQLLRLGRQAGRLAVDLRLWRDRNAGGAEQPARSPRGDDARYTHWSGGSHVWPLCGEQFAVRQTRDSDAVTCPACRGALEQAAAPTPPDPADAPADPAPLTSDDYYNYGEPYPAEPAAAVDLEAGDLLHGGHAWHPGAGGETPPPAPAAVVFAAGGGETLVYESGVLYAQGGAAR